MFRDLGLMSKYRLVKLLFGLAEVEVKIIQLQPEPQMNNNDKNVNGKSPKVQIDGKCPKLVDHRVNPEMGAAILENAWKR